MIAAATIVFATKASSGLWGNRGVWECAGQGTAVTAVNTTS